MLKESLSIDLVTTQLVGRNKHEVIEALMELISKSGKIIDREQALRDVLDHEAGMSTGMENGIAIPHAKTDAVDELVACVGITRRKIDFENLDRKPSQIFIMTLSPKSGTGPHVQFLAEISRLLTDAKTRKAMIKAKSDEDLLHVLTD
ncbi:MAG TPA: PTS sugar transporter subunit IIA [Spirochaetia bacterium]|nr:PTS sugar transporter subunit IIA [Spirochaetia bacterium]